jgi:hypothetical protein
VKAKEIERRDGRGTLQVLPGRDVIGQHGKTYIFVGFDEIHGYRTWDLFEALAPDPTRPDALTWITSYDTIFNAPGVPLYDLKRQAAAGSDSRMYFSWYSANECTDPAFADLEPEQRANPSMASWPDGPAYLVQQKARLPTHRYRRLHLNLPGTPEGAYFDAASVLACVIPGRKRLAPREGVTYRAFVDMSGGSSDDAVLGIAHEQDGVAVLDLLMNQGPPPPFNPRHAVRRFAEVLREYRCGKVVGDRYAGETFRADFAGARDQLRGLAADEVRDLRGVGTDGERGRGRVFGPRGFAGAAVDAGHARHADRSPARGSRRLVERCGGCGGSMSAADAAGELRLCEDRGWRATIDR